MLKIYDLRCNGLIQAYGLTSSSICYSWKIQGKNALKPVKYSLKVIDERHILIWEKEVDAAELNLLSVDYDGPELAAHGCYRWQVTGYDSNGERFVSQSDFTIGNTDNNWQALWIDGTYERKFSQDQTNVMKIFTGEAGPCEKPDEVLNPPICLRKTFQTNKKISKALAYATAHGIYRLSINGAEVGNLLAPEYTSYDKYLEINQYDITNFLIGNNHCIGAVLADGWYTGKIGLLGIGDQHGERNAFYFQAHIFYEDGTEEVVVSDTTFKWHTGDWDYADLFIGEKQVPGRLEDAWTSPDYDDRDWLSVNATSYSTEAFVGRAADPVKVIRTFEAVDIITTPSGELVIDAGENIVGWVKLTVKTTTDTTIELTHSEVLDHEGNFLMNILGQNKNQTDVYELKVAGEYTLEPYFTFHGFQYIKVQGLRKEDIIKAEIVVIGTELRTTGSFKCSDPMLNKLQENIFRSQQGNMISIPTDCPQRERAGWTGDMQVYAPTACFNMDVYAFLDKWLTNVELEQSPDGQIQNITPTMDSDKYIARKEGDNFASAAWGDACVIIPYTMYHKYGKKQILSKYYNMMKKWMDYVEREASSSFIDGVDQLSDEMQEHHKYLWNTGVHFGDWLYPSSENPFGSADMTKEYVAPTYFAYTSGLMAEISDILGMAEESHRYSTLSQRIKEAYVAVYFDEEGRLPVELQGLYVLSLATDCCPEDRRASVARHLDTMIKENGYRLDTGFASIAFLLDVLYENGCEETAYKLLNQDQAPSWLYEVKMGATTIWERWLAIMPDGTRTNASYNHFAFGCVGDFMYRRLGGLYEESPGYQKVLVAPDIDCGLSWAELMHECPYGEIQIRWERKAEAVSVDVRLPIGVEGILRIRDEEWVITQEHYELPVAVTC